MMPDDRSEPPATGRLRAPGLGLLFLTLASRKTLLLRLLALPSLRFLHLCGVHEVAHIGQRA